MIMLAATVTTFAWLMFAFVEWSQPMDSSKIPGTARALVSAVVVSGILIVMLLLRRAIRRRENRA